MAATGLCQLCRFVARRRPLAADRACCGDARDKLRVGRADIGAERRGRLVARWNGQRVAFFAVDGVCHARTNRPSGQFSRLRMLLTDDEGGERIRTIDARERTDVQSVAAKVHGDLISRVARFSSGGGRERQLHAARG